MLSCCIDEDLVTHFSYCLVFLSFSSCLALLRSVLADGVTEELLESRLHEHVEAKDAEMELQHSDEAIADLGQQQAQTFFIAGMEMEHLELKTIFGEDFKITYW